MNSLPHQKFWHVSTGGFKSEIQAQHRAEVTAVPGLTKDRQYKSQINACFKARGCFHSSLIQTGLWEGATLAGKAVGAWLSGAVVSLVLLCSVLVMDNWVASGVKSLRAVHVWAPLA